MKNATLALISVLGILAAGASWASLPQEKVAVVRVTAIDGFAHSPGDVTDSRSSAFTFDGTEYHIDRSALVSTEGIETLVLIDRRRDEMNGTSMVRRFSQEVRAYPGASFEVTDLKGKVLSYQVAMLGGNLRLLGDGDQITAAAGTGGPYHIWKVTGVDLVDRSAVVLH